MANEAQLNKMKRFQEEFRKQMFNVVKSDPWVPITLGDGVERKLEFSYGAVVDVYQQTGFNINAGDINPSDLSNLDLLVALIQAGLATHDPTIKGMTMEQFRNLIRMKHVNYYIFAVQEAITATQPDQEMLTRIMAEDVEKDKDTEGKPEELPLVVTPIS